MSQWGFQGTVYRAHNPRWSFAPESGAGAAKHGGRFNRPGREALYTSSTYELAIAEAHQGLPGKLQPLTIVSYRVDHEAVLDLSSEIACDAAGVSFAELGCAWERIADEGNDPPTWVLADRLMAEGIGGIIVPSFAVGAPMAGVNLVFWHWSSSSPNRVQVIDDHKRLPKSDVSWQ